MNPGGTDALVAAGFEGRPGSAEGVESGVGSCVTPQMIMILISMSIDGLFDPLGAVFEGFGSDRGD